MAEQAISERLRKQCEEIRRLNLRTLEARIRVCEHEIREIDSVLNRLQLKEGDDFDNLTYNREHLEKSIKEARAKHSEISGMSIEQVYGQIKKMREDIKSYKESSELTVKLLRTSREDLEKTESEEVLAEKDQIEADLREEAMWDLGIKEKDANTPKNKERIAKAVLQLRDTRTTDAIDSAMQDDALLAKTDEELADRKIKSLSDSLNYHTGELRKYSLAEAMGVQVEDRVYARANEDRVIDLSYETVEKITELSEEDFVAMLEQVAKEKARLDKIAARRDKVATRGEKYTDAIGKITFAGLGTMAAGIGAVVTAAVMAETNDPSVVNAIGNTGVAVSAVGGATFVSGIPGGIINTIVDKVTKKSGVEAGKVVEKYLKNLQVQNVQPGQAE